VLVLDSTPACTTCHILKLKCTKFVFCRGEGFALDPAGGAYDAPPDPLVGWGGGYPLPITHSFDAFGVSVSASLVPLFRWIGHPPL